MAPRPLPATAGRALLLVALCAAFALSAPPRAFACWLPPVGGPVVDAFRRPACPWCPGNRGLEYATGRGEPVRAASAGTVAFAGEVAGEVFVSVEVPGGLVVTYGRLAARRVDAGQRVRAGQIVGRASGGMILTVRRAGEYVDPAPLLGRWVARVRLVPTDGAPARPAPAPRLECPP